MSIDLLVGIFATFAAYERWGCSNREGFPHLGLTQILFGEFKLSIFFYGILAISFFWQRRRENGE